MMMDVRSGRQPRGDVLRAVPVERLELEDHRPLDLVQMHD